MKYAVNELLERTPPPGYMQEWADLLTQEANTPSTEGNVSLLLFRLGKEWLTLPITVFLEVCERRAIHTIPHLRSPLVMGVVNFRGQLRVCIALHRLLDITSSPDARFLAIEKENQVFVFPVDEVYGVVSLEKEAFANVPVTILKSAANYMKGVFIWNEKRVGCLDDDLLFFSLRRQVR